MPKKGVNGYTRKKHIDQNEIMKIKWRFANKFMCIHNERRWAALRATIRRIISNISSN